MRSWKDGSSAFHPMSASSFPPTHQQSLSGPSIWSAAHAINHNTKSPFELLTIRTQYEWRIAVPYLILMMLTFAIKISRISWALRSDCRNSRYWCTVLRFLPLSSPKDNSSIISTYENYREVALRNLFGTRYSSEALRMQLWMALYKINMLRQNVS